MSTTLTAPWLLPPNEAERLRTLHHYANSACLYEPVLSGFIDLAAQIFTLPIAFLSLVDAHEVTCKINLNPPQLVRLPRTASVCALTVRLNAPLIFTDLTQQNQYGRLTTAAAATILAHGVQFYVSIPLRLADQQPIGTLCLASYQPRSFSPLEQQVLEQIAGLVAQTLVIRQICLASDRLGEENWSNIQTTLTEDLWEFAALIRYLLQRSGTQEPVAPAVLAQAGRRLVELHSTLAVYPGSQP